MCLQGIEWLKFGALNLNAITFQLAGEKLQIGQVLAGLDFLQIQGADLQGRLAPVFWGVLSGYPQYEFSVDLP